jgi:hypothetical protein
LLIHNLLSNHSLFFLPKNIRKSTAHLRESLLSARGTGLRSSAQSSRNSPDSLIFGSFITKFAALSAFSQSRPVSSRDPLMRALRIAFSCAQNSQRTWSIADSYASFLPSYLLACLKNARSNVADTWNRWEMCGG